MTIITNFRPMFFHRPYVLRWRFGRFFVVETLVGKNKITMRGFASVGVIVVVDVVRNLHVLITNTSWHLAVTLGIARLICMCALLCAFIRRCSCSVLTNSTCALSHHPKASTNEHIFTEPSRFSIDGPIRASRKHTCKILFSHHDRDHKHIYYNIVHPFDRYDVCMLDLYEALNSIAWALHVFRQCSIETGSTDM